ncbi:ATPase H(+)-transporting accessory protein 2-like [Penaeus vannamei]|uniref:ATPase H(+)-transporting accessory protein 2 n=1 Tax=Penaeus vannamei TaxID=6689 RepID=UPI000F65F1D6|nr:renin receptor-like [Penaeus vannamei]
MEVQTVRWLSLFSLLYTAQCGEVTVAHSPSNLRFGSAGVLRATHLDDVLAASLGYTPESAPWKGLTITSPFNLPIAAVVVEVHGGGASVRQEGSTYSLKEDTTLDDVFQRMKAVIGYRAQRETLFKRITVDDNLDEDKYHGSTLSSEVLSPNEEPDSTFLREMDALVDAAEKVGDITTTAHGGQDIIFLQVNSLAPLVKTYGPESAKVKEAEKILRKQLVQVTDMMRHIYNDRVLVATATVEQLEELSRSSRSILQSEDVNLEDYNLATQYTSDYPAIFNIVLWLSIILLLAVLATSVAMATMDPGRDSIIYRMTNPRMKKDN